MRLNQLSGRERGEENLAKVRRYLDGLKATGQSVPLQDGGPNITAIALSSGVLRNVFYTNAGVKRLLAEFIGAPGEGKQEPTGLTRAQRQLDIKERRILQLEQQLASVRVEAEELRKRLAAAEQKLTRYRVIEEEILLSGPAGGPVRISAVATITTVYPGPRGGAIFSGRDTAGKRLRFVAGYNRICRAPVVGETWSLAGEIRQHPRYGDQVYVEQASLIQPRGQLIIDFLSKHPAFDGLGIGKAKATRLWKNFGLDLYEILSQGRPRKTHLCASGGNCAETGGGLAGGRERGRHHFVSRYARLRGSPSR